VQEDEAERTASNDASIHDAGKMLRTGQIAAREPFWILCHEPSM